MKASEIRQSFLDFFADRDHRVVPSAPLVPQDDPTLFFVNAGMVQFKDVFTGAEPRPAPRAASVQKCLRVSGKHNDLDMVGRTPRHHTFFEMLGNFSFGDYFKSEAVDMAWEWLTGTLGLDPARLWVTIYLDDDEAFDAWRSIGFPADRIQRLGAAENFWAMGDVGPCGPCSEIHYDHGAAIDPRGGGPATESPRYVEIWNLVFMQYEQRADGTRVDLPQPSIDTGSGLERVAAAMQGVFSNYETDLFTGLIAQAGRLAGVRPGADRRTDTALQVIADHARASAFLVGDGVMPSNEGRGYVLRRIMRRAIRFGVEIGLDEPFLHQVARSVVSDFGEVYPELGERSTFIDEVIQAEEGRFRSTLDRGLRLLHDALDQAGAGGVLPGEVAFTLSDTYGFPLDLTRLIASERDISVDEPGFERELEAQRERGRAAWKGSGEAAVASLWQDLAGEVGDTEFTGHGRSVDVSEVLALVRRQPDDEGEVQHERVERLSEGEEGVLVCGRTPFYAEAGGQVGDTGQAVAGQSRARIGDTRAAAGLHLHYLRVERGALSVGDAVELRVDAETRRDHVRRNHTATHLLHAALREVLGDHVEQKGSLVEPERLRFDLSHHRAIEADELRRVEDLVNEQILRNTPVQTEITDLATARSRGAMALFGERYADRVRVVSVPGFSIELCGGTHVDRTGDIGSLRITSEGAVAAGVRRVEAVTGTGALHWSREREALLARTAASLKTSPDQLPASIRRLQDDKRRAEAELAELQVQVARDAARDLVSEARDYGGVKVVAAEFDGDLREQADRLRDQLGTSLVVLAARRGDKVQLVAAATRDIAGDRVHAGRVIKEIASLVGGGGGGRPDMAQAGGRDPSGIPAALERVHAWAAEHLGD